MIRALHFTNGKRQSSGVTPSELAAALKDQNGLLWLDFQGEPDRNTEPILRDIFHFHQLSIEDALTETHVPRVDDWETYLYVVLHSIILQPEDDDLLVSRELDVFVGPNYIVTHHDEPVEAVERVWTNVHRDERHLKMGPDHVLYRLADELVVDYMTAIDSLDEEIELLEDRIFGHPTGYEMERIFTLKRAILQLRRILSPQREVLNRLARDDYDMIDARDRVYFRDVYDHLVRLHDITEGLRDLVSSTIDSYLSVINNRMNEIMKTLTVITTLFMPLSFIASFFGMNFFAPDPGTEFYEWVSPPVFLLTMVLMGIIPITMFIWMRHRRWM